jgi:ribokinase
MDMVLEMDRIPDKDDSLDALSLDYFPGGKGANTAVAAYRASHNGSRSGVHAEVSTSSTGNEKSEIRVFMNGAVGNDAFGTQLKTKLEESGVDVSGIMTVEDEKSGTCVVLVEANSGESRNVGYQGANLKWKPRDEDSVECLAGGEKPDLVICDLGTPRELVTQVLAAASKNGVETLLNAAPAHILENSTYKHITHLLLNRNEAAMLSGREVDELTDLEAWGNAAEYFIQLGVKNVVITLGKRGAYYATHKGEKGIVEAVPNIKVVDTTGAGYVIFPPVSHLSFPRNTESICLWFNHVHDQKLTMFTEIPSWACTRWSILRKNKRGNGK